MPISAAIALVLAATVLVPNTTIPTPSNGKTMIGGIGIGGTNDNARASWRRIGIKRSKIGEKRRRIGGRRRRIGTK